MTALRFCRRDDLPVTRVDDDAFVVVPATEAVFHMNSLGRALWDLLAEPCSAAELTEAIAEAFPDQRRDDIARDIEAFMTRLRDHALISPAS